MAELIEVPPGLAGVAVTYTRVGDVLGDEGLFHYRGRSVVELAQEWSFEEMAALVLDESGAPAVGARDLPAPAVAAFDALATALDLRSALSLVAASVCSGPLVDISPAELRADAVRLISVLPTLVASVHHGRALVPDPALSHAADYLRMVAAAPGAPTPQAVRALETYLNLTIDHGFNTGTFAARVIASTGADLGACLVGALGALSGPRHGAVQGRVLEMFDAIGEPANAEDWMKAELRSGRRLLGFGHAVYRVTDPRSVCLAEVLAEVDPARAALVEAVAAAGGRLLAGRRLSPNVDLYSSVLLEACGIPRSLFTATFAVSRIVGWCAHVLEQAEERKVIRPAAYYVGAPPGRG